MAHGPQGVAATHTHRVQRSHGAAVGYGWANGFYRLYEVNVGSDHDDDEGRSRVVGLGSPHGRRGAICAQMGWSWEFLHHGISWALVQRILADQARIVDGKEKKTVRLTEKNADEIIKQLLGG